MSDLHVEVSIIDKVEKHPNADKLDVVTIKGWNCIVGLNELKQGEEVIYIPPDSIIPKELIEKYHLYRDEKQEDGSIERKTYFKTNYENGSARMTTQKIRGVISQGLVLPLTKDEKDKWPIGTDVAKELGIIKWESGKAKWEPVHNPSKYKQNPLFDKYTSIENIKNYNKIFSEEDIVYITEKIHGTNFRCGVLPIYLNNSNIFKKILLNIKKKFFGDYEFVYGSHNVQIKSSFNKKGKSYYGEDVYGRIAKKYDLKNKLPKDYILYGEIYGKGIQDLTYGLDDIDLVVFDIKYKGQYLSYSELNDFCVNAGLPMAPLLYLGKWNPELLDKYTAGKSILCPSQIREGCVICSKEEENNMYIGRKILKSISGDYLMRKNATEYH